MLPILFDILGINMRCLSILFINDMHAYYRHNILLIDVEFILGYRKVTIILLLLVVAVVVVVRMMIE